MSVPLLRFLAVLLALSSAGVVLLPWIDPWGESARETARTKYRAQDVSGFRLARGDQVDLGPFVLAAGALGAAAAVAAWVVGARGRRDRARVLFATAFALLLAEGIVAGTVLLRGPGEPGVVMRLPVVPAFEWAAYLAPAVALAAAGLCGSVVARTTPIPDRGR